MLRRRRQALDDASVQLLSELIQAPVAEARLRPAVLRSLPDRRRIVLAPYPLKTWVDRALTLGERGLLLIVLVIFGGWLLDGYVRDWWHLRTASPPPLPAQADVAPPTTAVPSVGAASHVALGRSLPVVDERWSRPRVEVDYLAPAQSYVPPLRPTPSPAPIQPVDLRPTQLTIPALGLDAPVVEVFLQNGVWQVADYAVGYHHGTGVAGHGNMVLAGHAGIRGAVFRNLEQLKPGDEVIVTAAGRHFRYRVRTAGSVWPNQVEVMYPTDQPQLTMMTCTNWDMQRWVVVADFEALLPARVATDGS